MLSVSHYVPWYKHTCTTCTIVYHISITNYGEHYNGKFKWDN